MKTNQKHTPGPIECTPGESKYIKTRYFVYKVFDSTNKMLVGSYGTRNQARRLEKLLFDCEHRDWTPEIWTEINGEMGLERDS